MMTPLDAAAAAPLPASAGALALRHGALDGVDLLRVMMREVFSGRIAVVSSFGTEAALTLALVAEVDAGVPVIFLDTLKHFDETLAYRDALVARLGLSDARSIRPDPADLAEDPAGTLWRSRPDRCCTLRKVWPLARALAGFDAWVTGRKRLHGGARMDLPTIESDGHRVKVNPLARWSRAEVDAAWARYGLPEHPLVAQGYTSVGCLPCSAVAAPGAGPRAGRWAFTAKTECGIHTFSGEGI